MIDEIINCTNEKIFLDSTDDFQKLETTEEAVKARIGLLFLAGLSHFSRENFYGQTMV